MGGSTGTGITSGLDKPRTNYQFGGGAGMAADNIRLSDLPFMKNQNETPSITIDKPQETTSMLPSEQLMKAFADRDTKPDVIPSFEEPPILNIGLFKTLLFIILCLQIYRRFQIL